MNKSDIPAWRHRKNSKGSTLDFRQLILCKECDMDLLSGGMVYDWDYDLERGTVSYYDATPSDWSGVVQISDLDSYHQFEMAIRDLDAGRNIPHDYTFLKCWDHRRALNI